MIDNSRVVSHEIWQGKIDNLYYAYQPIVNIHTGSVLGFEALLRGYREAGFNSIEEVFSRAYEETVLYSLDLFLRDKAVTPFYERDDFSSLKLFYNLDNRVLEMPDYLPGNTEKLLDKLALFTTNICFEISEKHEFSCYESTQKILNEYKSRNYKIAIDDFGSGYSGLTLLYHSEPDFIKIDRFFIENINNDSRKKFFVSNVVYLAHMMGMSVIAEGIESAEEFYVCREIGCDYVQGYLIQRPEGDRSRLKLKYDIVETLTRKQVRYENPDKALILSELNRVTPVSPQTSTERVLERFRDDLNLRNLPVINNSGEPLGLLRETDLKKFVYSPFGISILHHKTGVEGLESLICRIPQMDVSNPIEKIIQLYSINNHMDNVIITENGQYLGILESRSILKILSEKKIAQAMDQNPLTKLPGNRSINEYIAFLTGRTHDCSRVCVYFDFDNFKPFNDNYGFRQGDRIIRLFADLLRENRVVPRDFIGHIGGDDFFAGYKASDNSLEDIEEEVRLIIHRFKQDVIPFYNQQDKDNGFITAKNRNGRMVKLPLLSVSAVILILNSDYEGCTTEFLSEKIALMKKKAKRSSDHISILTLERTAEGNR